MIKQDCAVVRSGDRGSQGRLNDLLDTRTSSSDFRDTVVEVEISLGSYDGQFNSTILVSVDQWEVPNFNASSNYSSLGDRLVSLNMMKVKIDFDVNVYLFL